MTVNPRPALHREKNKNEARPFVVSPPAARQTRPVGRWIITSLALISLCLLTYGPAQLLPLIADDYLQIELGRQYGPVTGWAELLRDPLYRCRAISLMMTHWTEQLVGMSTFAFYFSSLILHILNTLLMALFGLWKRIGWPVSVSAAAFFAVSEIHHEAVMWYSALPELQVFFFVIAAFLCWVLYLEDPRRPVSLYAATLALFILAQFSKESAVAFVGLQVLGLCVCAGARRKDAFRILPFAAIAVVYFALAWSARFTHQHFNDGTFSFTAPFWWTLVNSTARMLWMYGLLAIAALAAWNARAVMRTTGAALAWMIIALLPYSFLLYMSRVPSRHTYLASAGLALLTGVAAVTFYRRFSNRRLAVAVLAAVVVFGNAGYIWTRKQRQFAARAAPTEALLEALRVSDTTVVVECFPYPLGLIDTVVRVTEPSNRQRIKFDLRQSCDREEYRYSTAGMTFEGTQLRSGTSD